jgi:hypothetical protein
MRIDLYTRVMLTIIAACLVWLSLGGSAVLTDAHAQSQSHVLIAGWIDHSGKKHTLECCGNEAALPVWVVNK